MSCTTCGFIATQAKHIVQGFTNLAINKVGIKDTEQYAIDRLEICKSNIGGCANLFATIGNTAIIQCNSCKCFVEAKARVKDEKCPMNKW